MPKSQDNRIVFMGTAEFAVPSLYKLAAGGYSPVAVVTGPDKPRGRGRQIQFTPVKKAALELGLNPILQPSSVKDPEFADEIAALKPDIIVVVAFRILPPAVYTQARLGAFNLHGSLLPRYRGAAPIQRAVMDGEETTGVTTFFLEQKVDTGTIILQKKVSVHPNDTAGDVYDRLKDVGAEAVLETVQQIIEGTVEVTPQNDALASPAPKLFKEDGLIPWEQPAHVVHNHIRGVTPVPGAWTRLHDKILKVYRAEVADGKGVAGTVLHTDGRVVVACGQGALALLELQAEGRRRLGVKDFLNGYRIESGDVLGE